ncbi:MAG: nucleotidyl transferase AbiEii/AbiGii toxin family protein [Bergeyella sp.]
MLQTQAVSSECLELLKNISETEFFSDFVLVGGTALALQIGHRNSIDLDFFGNKEINEELYVNELQKFGDVNVLKVSKNILITSVNGIKTDFVNYTYPWISEKKGIENIQFASKEDIAAMKLNAISGRGSKKDFIDLFFLLKEFSLEEMIGFYRKKYTNHSEFGMLKSITYFEDADAESAPEIFHRFDWEICKEKIREAFSNLKL